MPSDKTLIDPGGDPGEITTVRPDYLESPRRRPPDMRPRPEAPDDAVISAIGEAGKDTQNRILCTRDTEGISVEI